MLPYYAHSGDAGLDLFAVESAALPPSSRKQIRTGLVVQLPAGTEGQIRPRSGLALDYGITVLNSPGTIDEGFRGELSVLLINHGEKEFLIKPGMKIAQLVISTVISVEVLEVRTLDELSRTARGEKGFGSTTDA